MNQAFVVHAFWGFRYKDIFLKTKSLGIVQMHPSDQNIPFYLLCFDIKTNEGTILLVESPRAQYKSDLSIWLCIIAPKRPKFCSFKNLSSIVEELSRRLLLPQTKSPIPTLF